MNRQFELGVPIAERHLEFETRTGERTPVIVRVGRPVIDESAPHEDWVCPFQIEGLGSGRVMGIFGVDAMQALVLAIHTIPAELAHHLRHQGGRLLHLGHPDVSFVASCRTVLEHTSGEFPPEEQ